MADKELNEMEAEIEATEEVSASENTSETKKSEKKVKSAPKKKNFFVRVGAFFKRFWKTMKSELKKVTWFSRKQTYTSTLLVLIVMAVSAIVIGALDFGFSIGLETIAKNVNIF